MKKLSILQGDLNARVYFVDNTPQAVPFGTERYAYKSSYYQVASNTITAFNVGPRNSDVHLVTVAKGSQKQLTESKTVTGSVQYSGVVSAEIKQVINLTMTNQVSGSYSYTWGTTRVYNGPDGNFTTRDYYGAINYDQYNTVVVKKYDVYDVYAGTVYLGTETLDGGTTYVNGVKKPHSTEYYVDSNQV
ncbi:hypothetical protein [Paenibacillus montanisoli]|uniref:Uncharacterized protein n=1 Tax=Paenibacillus montanisoli TaxID=2081970 RepID=A0A328U8T5_9BACL|nr:hypothetical protein [Paenibacillus montanisoli]RAP77315.1 hypothetical protein DL346_02120 [Paenibacillus montanisoli]